MPLLLFDTLWSLSEPPNDATSRAIIVCNRLLQVYEDEQHVRAVSTQLNTQLERHADVFTRLEQAAQQAEWGDLPEVEWDRDVAQQLASEAYLLTTEALYQANQDMLQTLRKPPVHKQNGLEWPVSDDTRKISEIIVVTERRTHRTGWVGFLGSTGNSLICDQ